MRQSRNGINRVLEEAARTLRGSSYVRLTPTSEARISYTSPPLVTLSATKGLLYTKIFRFAQYDAFPPVILRRSRRISYAPTTNRVLEEEARTLKDSSLALRVTVQVILSLKGKNLKQCLKIKKNRPFCGRCEVFYNSSKAVVKGMWYVCV
ncbi:MAG TPA: hypothetical protein H9673_02325 [Candidatus Adamsella sp.]|nr:hypothetical protein [Candidatus Adamsella sp.]